MQLFFIYIKRYRGWEENFENFKKKTVQPNAHDQNLILSTDPNPSKCKRKCIAFLKKQRDISPLILCANP